MTDDNDICLSKPEQHDPLQEVLREGARKMLDATVRCFVIPKTQR